MKATDQLKNEHTAVERVLRVLERATDRLDAGEDVPEGVFENSLDFIKNFVDRCHHGKEELALFPAMAKAGVPTERGPISVMLAEHEEGRGYVRAMSEALEAHKRGEGTARAALAASARGYAGLLTQHIWKENNVLFNMADGVLSQDAQRELVDSFDRIESEHIGPGVHERYHQMIDELEGAMA